MAPGGKSNARAASNRASPATIITAEADVTEIVKLREQVGAEWQKQHDIKVSYTEVIVKAVAKALREHPGMNSSLGDDGIVTSERDDNLRVSAHAYNTPEDIDAVLASLARHRGLLA